MKATALNETAMPFGKVRLSPGIMALSSSFDGLPADPWCPDRTRRFSQYRLQAGVGGWAFDTLPQRPHVQHRRNNALMGGVLRQLEPVAIDASVPLDFAARAFDLDPACAWQADLHQWRMHCRAGRAVECVPEGPHQDGHRYVGVLVINRANVSGGESVVYDRHGRVLFADTLEAGEGLLLDDEQVLHDTSGITAGPAGGHRDIFVVCFNRWEERRYGESFERACRRG